MKVSMWRSMLEEVDRKHGDVHIFMGDMQEPGLEVREAVEPEKYGEEYLFISEC